jgi:hypothetical protein
VPWFKTVIVLSRLVFEDNGIEFGASLDIASPTLGVAALSGELWDKSLGNGISPSHPHHYLSLQS